MEDKEKVYYTMGNQPAFESAYGRLAESSAGRLRAQVKHSLPKSLSLNIGLNELTSVQEQSGNQKYAFCGWGNPVKAHIRAMQFTQPGKFEIWSRKLNWFMSLWNMAAVVPAYPSIRGLAAKMAASCITLKTTVNLKKQWSAVNWCGRRIPMLCRRYHPYLSGQWQNLPPSQRKLYQIVLDCPICRDRCRETGAITESTAWSRCSGTYWRSGQTGFIAG